MSTDQAKEFGFKDHWRVLCAMTLVSLSTFQYGLDFGVIGGLQAMVGFLKVRVKNTEHSFDFNTHLAIYADIVYIRCSASLLILLLDITYPLKGSS
jgi:hypothetical protein